MKIKLDKEAVYKVIFKHCNDEEDQIVEVCIGRNIFRVSNILGMSGYQISTFVKLN